MRRVIVGGVGVLLLAIVAAAQYSAIPPLPPSATQVPDRVSVEDATQDVSTKAVLSAPLPRRETAVPYVRQGVPEAQENRGGNGSEITPESPAPIAGTPRPMAPISASGGK